MSADILGQWLIAETVDVGRHALLVLLERDGSREAVVVELRQIVRSHYVAPDVAAKRFAELGAPKSAELLRDHLPTSKKARSGDLGEILATEVAERRLGYEVPVRRLRWKDGRDTALRGDDIVGLSRGEGNMLQFLKGESKSRAALASAVLEEAAESLDRDRGRPTRHSVLFVADRLREQGKDELAKELEEAVLQGFRSCTIEHMLFTFTGSNPRGFLHAHLSACRRRRRRHAVGVRINDHSNFIAMLFGGL